ncbi:MAG: hypothetical protein M3348_14145, partial [Acidobacteriota bacterium]|nr:hypothetical protein [Acidobacteriota bacterium]
LVPGPDPLSSLAGLIGPRGENTPDDPEQLAQALVSEVTRPALITIDQFEEVFTLCNDAKKRYAFLDSLLSLTRLGHFVVVTMRSDFIEYVKELTTPEAAQGAGGEARSHPFAEAFDRGQVLVTPMDAGELTEAIVKPAQAIRLKFEEGVVKELVREVVLEPAALPLLQFTLLKLWENRSHNLITRSALRALGGARGALGKTAEYVYTHLLPEQQPVMRSILLRMIAPSEGLEFTSSRIGLTTLFANNYAFESVRDVLETLLDYKLVRLTGREVPADSIKELKPGEVPEDVQVEVAHEALVRNWKRLADWLLEARASMLTHRRMEGWAADWERLDRKGGLLDRVQLYEAERWLGSAEAANFSPSESLRQLVAASKSRLKQEELAKDRQNKLLINEQKARADQAQRAQRLLLFIVIMLIGGGAILAFLAYEAVLQSRLAGSNRLAAQSLIYLDKQPDLSLLLSSEAVSISEGNVSATNSLIRSLDAAPELKMFLSSPGLPVNDFAFPTDSTLIGYGGGTISSWDLVRKVKADGPRRPLEIKASRAALSPRGDLLALVSESGGKNTLTVVNVADGRPKWQEPLTMDNAVTALAFNRGGDKLAVAAVDVFWIDVSTGRPEGKPLGGTGENAAPPIFRTLTFDDGGQLLAGGATEGLVRVWEVESGKVRWQNLISDDRGGDAKAGGAGQGASAPKASPPSMSGPVGSEIEKIAFLPGSSKLVIAISNGRVRVKSLDGKGEAEESISGTGSPINDLVSAPGREVFAWSDKAGRLYICNGSKPGSSLLITRMYASPIQSLAFSPDGMTLAAGALDGSVSLWSVWDPHRQMFKQRLPARAVPLLGVA